MKVRIAGYDYFSTRQEAAATVTDIKDQVIANEGGLGWYVYSRSDYEKYPERLLKKAKEETKKWSLLSIQGSVDGFLLIFLND